MARGVSRLPFTAKARVLSHSSPYEICGGESGTEQFFVRVLRCSAVSIIPSTRLTRIRLHVAPTRTRTGEACEPSK
jgi:hypothetical protein